MKLFKLKKAIAVLAAASILSTVPAAAGALNDSSLSSLAASNTLAQECLEKYKKQFGDNATKTNAFEIVKQYQDKADGLILIFENHEKRKCIVDKVVYIPHMDLSVFSKGNYDNSLYDNELIIKRCKNHAIYDKGFEKFDNDSDVIDIIKEYQEMVDEWVSRLIDHEHLFQKIELHYFNKIYCNNLESEFLK